MEARAEPKYKVAYGALLSRLVSGRYPIGGRLPTEDELARTFDISRVTIRRSLDMLVNEGFLERRQGSGYTVISLSPPSSMCLSSFTDAMLRAGREPSSRLIRISTLEAGAQGGELIGELHDERLTCIERLRLVDDEPQMLVRTWVPARLLSDATAEDFPNTGHEQSILRILRQRFGLEWNAACEDISPAGAPEDVAKYLQIEPGRPLLVQACTAFDEDGGVVFYEQVYRIGKVSFNLTGASREAR
ncbi:GntR family transcriptional regulator [Hoeflea sp.]|uniref:GntR family transcriptional regulator n=1 Tax=Hoeflea sp. TaxID=1940281 RepID=UPI003B025448